MTPAGRAWHAARRGLTAARGLPGGSRGRSVRSATLGEPLGRLGLTASLGWSIGPGCARWCPLTGTWPRGVTTAGNRDGTRGRWAHPEPPPTVGVLGRAEQACHYARACSRGGGGEGCGV